MDDDYLRQRTDEILRQRIALGMTGGEYDEESFDIGMGEGYSGSGSAIGAKKTQVKLLKKKRAGRDAINAAEEGLYKALKKKHAHLSATDKTLYNRLHKRFGKKKVVRRVVKKRSGSKARKRLTTKEKEKRHCARLKTQYRREVCDYQLEHPRLSYSAAMKKVSKPKRKIPRGVDSKKKYCKDKNYSNPWIFYLCRYRAAHGNLPKYQGQDGQRRLVHEASIKYKKEKHRLGQFGYGEGECEGYGDGIYY